MKIVKNERRKCGGLELGNGRRRDDEGSSAGWLASEELVVDRCISYLLVGGVQCQQI
jgi:hypothetical protein